MEGRQQPVFTTGGGAPGFWCAPARRADLARFAAALSSSSPSSVSASAAALGAAAPFAAAAADRGAFSGGPTSWMHHPAATSGSADGCTVVSTWLSGAARGDVQVSGTPHT